MAGLRPPSREVELFSMESVWGEWEDFVRAQ